MDQIYQKNVFPVENRAGSSMNTSVCFFVVNVYTTVVFEQSEDLKDVIILNILKKKKNGYVLPPGVFSS